MAGFYALHYLNYYQYQYQYAQVTRRIYCIEKYSTSTVGMYSQNELKIVTGWIIGVICYKIHYYLSREILIVIIRYELLSVVSVESYYLKNVDHGLFKNILLKIVSPSYNL